jgi:hypothetical protein
MTDDLTAFLNARLAEDEAVANAAASAALASYWLPSEPSADPGYAAFRLHVASHDPFRVLREVEAMRKILADRWGGPDHQDMWEHHVRLLAAIWSDHPDYRPEWTP